MKVVALVSGGKDSTMNMLECIAHGHEIIALANLYPKRGLEEIDSYMFQSVGHDVIVAFAACCHLPLYRKEITGQPINQEYEYKPTDQDEVEDLFELLLEVKQAHPEVEAVSSGAIHSAYQKNRVENVCSRLGLTSLAYLWGQDQSVLLDKIIHANIHAIIVKTAVIGLNESDLGKSIKELQPKLIDLQSKHGINVCGEGGEFETLTLDCPLFKTHKMQLNSFSVIKHKECYFAPVSFIKIRSLELVEKIVCT